MLGSLLSNRVWRCARSLAGLSIFVLGACGASPIAPQSGSAGNPPQPASGSDALGQSPLGATPAGNSASSTESAIDRLLANVSTPEAPAAAPPGTGAPAPVAPTVAATPASGITGSYTISSSSNPGGGGGYRGSVAISQRGESYVLKWTIPNTPMYAGVAIQMGDILAVGWSQAGTSLGVVAYQVDGGSLRGKWVSVDSGAIGVEDLSGPAGLNGTYQIVNAHAPGGGSYGGSVRIQPTGETYQLSWKLQGASYSGVGILRNGVLSVGWGTGNVGVVAYGVQAGTLNGAWATPNGSQIGTEVLSR